MRRGSLGLDLAWPVAGQLKSNLSPNKMDQNQRFLPRIQIFSNRTFTENGNVSRPAIAIDDPDNER